MPIPRYAKINRPRRSAGRPQIRARGGGEHPRSSKSAGGLQYRVRLIAMDCRGQVVRTLKGSKINWTRHKALGRKNSMRFRKSHHRPTILKDVLNELAGTPHVAEIFHCGSSFRNDVRHSRNSPERRRVGIGRAKASCGIWTGDDADIGEAVYNGFENWMQHRRPGQDFPAHGRIIGDACTHA